MKRSVILMTVALVLVVCEDANKMIDQAQQAANDAVDSVQSQVESLNLEQLNLEQFGDAKQSAQEFTASLEEIISLDYTDPLAISQATDKFANAYQCLVDATSTSSAEKLLNGFLESIGSAQAESLIEQGLAKAEQAQSCVTP